MNSLRLQAERRHNRWKLTLRALAGAFCLLCVMAGTVAGSFYWKSDIFRMMVGKWMHDPIGSISDPLKEFTPEKQLPPDKQHVINVLLLGCDKDLIPGKPIPDKNSNGRSDAILLARVDFDRQTIQALSIPRDTAVTFPNDRGIHKINAAHSQGGPLLTCDTIRHTFGINIDYYATLDFEGFQKVVDELGGIEIDVPKAMKYDDNWGNLHIDLKPGLQKLDGYQAMGFVRFRHNDSDLARAERQQQFVEALRSKVKDRSNFLKLPGVLQALTESIKTNMTQEQMLALGNFARKLPRENVKLATLPVTPSRVFVYINPRESEALIRDMFFPDGLTPVSINAPARTQLANRRGSSRKRSRRPRQTAAETPLYGSEPIEENTDAETAPDNDAPPSDAGETPPPPETDSSGNPGEGAGETSGSPGIESNA